MLHQCSQSEHMLLVSSQGCFIILFQDDLFVFFNTEKRDHLLFMFCVGRQLHLDIIGHDTCSAFEIMTGSLFYWVCET